ncbi:MAG: universal stress protein [Planctomycetota bacterium]
MSRILVAVSSPQASERAVVPVADLASRLDAEVLVVHVTRPSGTSNGSSQSDRGEQAVRTLGDKIRAKGVSVQTLLMFSDDVAQAILATAEERNASLILLGLTNKGVFQRIVAGNVPVELLRNTKVPVLLLPPDYRETL